MTRSDNYCCEAFKLSGIVTDPFLLEHHLYHSVNFFLRDGSTIEEVMVLLSVLGEDVSFGRIILWRLGWRQLCCCYISLLLVHSGNIINRITDTENKSSDPPPNDFGLWFGYHSSSSSLLKEVYIQTIL